MKARLRFSRMYRTMLRWIPNALTLCNSLCGFAAILYTIHARECRLEGLFCDGEMQVFNTVAILIFCAMVFDAMDGLAARLLNAASMHGIQMDSLSDMVTFGVAPAVLVVMLSDSLYDWQPGTGVTVGLYLCGAIYLGGAALRLATYNVAAISNVKKNPNWFSGMPSPGAAAALCAVVFVMPVCGTFFKENPLIFPIYAALLGVLMVSGIPYIHAGRFLMSIRHNRRNMVILVLLVCIAAAFRLPGLAAIVTGYVLSGPAVGLWRLVSRKEQAER